MIKVGVQIRGLDATLAHLAGMSKQVRYATAVALTKTAKQAQAMTAQEMRRNFDRPTPTVLKSIYVKPATKANLEAMIYVKDRPLGGKNNLSMAEILRHQYTGGTRIAKNFENLMRANRYMASGEFIVPGAGARLNAYGNISPGQYVQVLSQIGLRRAGFDSTPTGSKRSRRNIKKAGEIFWSYGPGSYPAKAFTGSMKKIDWSTGKYLGKTQHLPKGAWMRTAGGVIPVMLVIKAAPRYRRRIVLEDIARRAVAQHFNVEFEQAFADAMRTAR